MYQETEETLPAPPRLVRQKAIKPVYFPRTNLPILERSVAMTYAPDIYGFYPNDYAQNGQITKNQIQIQIDFVLLKIENLERKNENLEKKIENLEKKIEKIETQK